MYILIGLYILSVLISGAYFWKMHWKDMAESTWRENFQIMVYMPLIPIVNLSVVWMFWSQKRNK